MVTDMPKTKRATEIKAGDKVILSDTGKEVIVKYVGSGWNRGTIIITHEGGWSCVGKLDLIEIA